MKVIEHILFEHSTSDPFFASEASDRQKREVFERLESDLGTIWTERRSGFLADIDFNPGVELGDAPPNQQFLSFDYKRYRITAGQYVGVVQNKDVRLTILPKLFSRESYDPNRQSADDRRLFVGKASRDLLYLLSYATELKTPEATAAPLSENRDLDFAEVFIYIFAAKALALYRRNFHKHYEEISENLFYLRGKLSFAEHMRRNQVKAQAQRLYCTYSSFQEDNLFNRVVKFVVGSLLRITKVDENKKILRQLHHLLADVDDQVCTVEHCKRIVFNHTQHEFTPILNYCRMFLSHSLIRFEKRSLDTFCLLIDMNALFEKFVANFLVKNFHGIDGIDIHKQKSDLFLTEEERFQLQHDVYIEHRGRPFLIIDTKYKPTGFGHSDGKGGIAQPDMYQMLSYCVRRKCNQSLLLYPKYSDDRSTDRLDFTVRDSLADQVIYIRAAKLDLINLPVSKRHKDEVLKDAFKELLSVPSLVEASGLPLTSSISK